ncbi:hypothetical protein NPIL_210511 [Nephila pilipes]|uniref:Uncharacterized protein n=1 Tax=Nephila pilipes TaxID=299642 RepID=A0A8X6PGD3_NEPPI|nr:hypothetical protein NPIL_210511 [Nephila pilipes]
MRTQCAFILNNLALCFANGFLGLLKRAVPSKQITLTWERASSEIMVSLSVTFGDNFFPLQTHLMYALEQILQRRSYDLASTRFYLCFVGDRPAVGLVHQ